MKGRFLTAEVIEEFGEHLVLEEKSEHTVEKYLRDVRAFWSFVGSGEITKETSIAYKHHLLETDYTVRSINSIPTMKLKLVSLSGMTANTAVLRSPIKGSSSSSYWVMEARDSRLNFSSREIKEIWMDFRVLPLPE